MESVVIGPYRLFTCAACKQVKQETKFYSASGTYRGRQYSCGTCQAAYVKSIRDKNPEKAREDVRRWQKANPEKKKLSYRQWYDSKADQTTLLLKNVKCRAKKKGMEFDLTLADIKIPSVCPVLGIPIAHSRERNAPTSPSIDRFDNTRGYTKDNIRIISCRANVLKSDATLEEMEAVVQYMRNE